MLGLSACDDPYFWGRSTPILGLSAPVWVHPLNLPRSRRPALSTFQQLRNPLKIRGRELLQRSGLADHFREMSEKIKTVALGIGINDRS